MMRILKGNEARAYLDETATASVRAKAEITASVGGILESVRNEGDTALRRLAERFGDPVADRFQVDRMEWEDAASMVSPELRGVLERAAENIRVFAEAVMESARPFSLERDGFTVGMDYRPVARAGCYVPAGRHPLPSTALMTAIPARTAGVREVCMACPSPTPEIFLAAKLAGADRMYRIGGPQAVAAFAFGTESIAPVDVIAGPGNAYVTEAKRRLMGRVGIDLLAGPSEVAVIADEGADPRCVALDLLAQCEHDPDARAWLLTTSVEIAARVADEIRRKLSELDLPNFVAESIGNSAIIVMETMEDCAMVSDRIAPEHLQLAVRDPQSIRGLFSNYGGLFLGYETTVPFGDYMAGPNHTLPTGRTARFEGGLSPWTFLRAQGWTDAGDGVSRLAGDSAVFAEIEGLAAHAAAARARS